jgi:hypothetical protein
MVKKGILEDWWLKTKPEQNVLFKETKWVQGVLQIPL